MVKIGSSQGNPYHPKIEKRCPVKAHELIIRCWATNPDSRPDLSYIAKQLKIINGNK